MLVVILPACVCHCIPLSYLGLSFKGPSTQLTYYYYLYLNSICRYKTFKKSYYATYMLSNQLREIVRAGDYHFFVVNWKNWLALCGTWCFYSFLGLGPVLSTSTYFSVIWKVLIDIFAY